MDSEYLGRTLSLETPSIDQCLTIGQVVGNFTVVAIGGHDQHDTVALGGGPRHRPAGADGLVVGMGMKANESSHQASTTAPLVINASIRSTAIPQSARISRECCPA